MTAVAVVLIVLAVVANLLGCASWVIDIDERDELSERRWQEHLDALADPRSDS